MKKEIYITIRSLLLGVQGVSSVKIWNNNLMEGLDTLGRFPLCFVEFKGLDYQPISGKVQECNGAKITVHVLYKTLDGEDTGVFDLSQAIFTAMQGYGFSRTSEAPIYSGGEIIDWQIHFDAPRFEDDGAKIQYISHPKPLVNIS